MTHLTTDAGLVPPDARTAIEHLTEALRIIDELRFSVAAAYVQNAIDILSEPKAK